MAGRPHRLYLGFNGRHVEVDCQSERLADEFGWRLGHVASTKHPGIPPVLRLVLDEPQASHFELSDATNRRAHGPLDYVLHYIRTWTTAAFISADPDLLWLHAAAAACDGAAVVLPGPPGTGKSTVVAELLKLSWHLLADDAVPVDVARRIVVPLPFNPNIRTGGPNEDGLATFMDRRKAVVSVSSNQVARGFGRIGAVVFVEFAAGRGDAVDVMPLTTVSRVEALGNQCLNTCVDKRESLHALWSVATAVPAYRLRYESASRAAGELSRRWSNGFRA